MTPETFIDRWAETWPGDAPLMFWVHCLIGGTDAFAFVRLGAAAAVLSETALRDALTTGTAEALGLPVSAVTVKAWRVTGEPPF